MFHGGLTVHIEHSDRVVAGLTRDIGSGRVVTTVKVVHHAQDGTGGLSLVAAPRDLRRVAQELLDAADAACRREDALTDTPLFEGVQ